MTSLLRRGGALLLHNPKCSKSRGAFELLRAAGAAFDVREYLQDPLSVDELLVLATRLKRPPLEWARTAEPAWVERFASDAAAEGIAADDPLEYSSKARKDLVYLRAIADTPALLERPIFLNGESAVVGRPPELVLALVGTPPPADGKQPPRYAVCQTDEDGEYEATLVETPIAEGADRLVAHLREVHGAGPANLQQRAEGRRFTVRQVDMARKFDFPDPPPK
tara:strand:+ start:421 stop:1089 length:669 start_codon:yes stop_codon:yes gene_type:complete